MLITGDTRIAVVSSADRQYFPLLYECLDSVKQIWPGDGPCLSLCAVESDLELDQKRKLTDIGVCIEPLRDHFSLLKSTKLRGRTYLLTTLVRAFLPDYFPGHDIYIWIDSDAWACDYSALELFILAAARDKLGVVTTTGRFSDKVIQVDRWWFKWARLRNFMLKNAMRSGLAHKDAHVLAQKPAVNSGIFSLSNTAPHWKCYQRHSEKIVRKGRIFGTDQLALGMVMFLDRLPFEILPEWCNWIGAPYYDRDKQRFVEPYLPHYPIGIMHLAGQDRMRADAGYTVPVHCLDGSSVDMSLRYGKGKRGT